MSATLSKDGLYRYTLWRQVRKEDLLTGNYIAYGETILFVMLNPSTADAEKDDPTIRRCLGFAHREGMEFLKVVNVYAYRATDPAELAKVVDPVGPENFEHVRVAAHKASKIVVAWGAGADKAAAENIVFELRAAGRPLYCLGTTKDGSPRHPLYVKKDQPLEVWKP